MDYDGKTVLVLSGTADSGEATVREADERDATVGLTYNAGGDAADALVDELDGGDHRAWQCDVTDRDDVASFVEEAFDEFGSVDAVVYNVGVIDRSSITEMDPEAWQSHLDTNVTGAFNVLREVGPRFEDQGEGAFVALAASDGVIRSPNLSAYDASKRGLIALVQEAARELGPSGVRANVVSPGFIRDPDALSEDDKQDLLAQQPYKQLTTPEAIANAALFLCSEDAATVTGAVLPVDSGLALS
jgi:3-oxoacyl-[acyl-carrier protein] reductase